MKSKLFSSSANIASVVLCLVCFGFFFVGVVLFLGVFLGFFVEFYQII